jgi:acyl carrier protein
METLMNIEAKVREFISNNFLLHDDDIELNPETSLLEAGVIDSTGVLELVSFIETEFNIQIGEDEIIPENLDSIVNITTFVKKKRSS